MIYGIHLSTSGALAEKARQENIANNLANSQTVGFRKDYLLFKQRAIEAMEGDVKLGEFNGTLDDIGGGVHLSETVTDFTDNNVRSEVTGNPFDLYLEGKGFFQVADSAGRTFYTRAGMFTRNKDGLVTTRDGRYSLLDSSGQPFRVGSTFEVSLDGVVSSDGAEVAQLGSRVPADYKSMVKVGANMYAYRGDEGGLAAGNANIRQNMLEKAGINEIQELTNMITSQRAYETNMNMVRVQDGTLDALINRVGRIA